jgi:hypothetical protein
MKKGGAYDLRRRSNAATRMVEPPLDQANERDLAVPGAELAGSGISSSRARFPQPAKRPIEPKTCSNSLLRRPHEDPMQAQRVEGLLLPGFYLPTSVHRRRL